MGLFLRRFALGVSILVVLVGLFSFTLPSAAHIERSITIQKPTSTIFPYLNNLKKFNEWSPWSKLDPETVYTFSGPTEGVGARVEWKSEQKSVGEGSQEIVESRLNELVKTDLLFGNGTPSKAQFYLDGTATETKVTWAFDAHFDGILERYFGLMMDKWVGGAYEEGLQNLKQLVEQ